VTVVVRAQSLAAGTSHYLIKTIEAAPTVEVRTGTTVAGGGGDGGAGSTSHGDDVGGQEWPLERRSLSLETSMPGVLAAGDIRHGSVKRVAAAVGEGSIAVQLVQRLFAEEGQDSPRAT
jgi:thioredoxin reductase (NADPH)